MAADTDKLSFWEHLDELRAALLKMLAVTVVFGIVAFVCKDTLFAVVFAPAGNDFMTYRMLYEISEQLTGQAAEDFSIKLINTGLARQFMVHVQTAMWAGVLCASPYILYQLFRFVSPALYTHERKYVVRVVGGGYAMFVVGVLLSYYLIFPLTFRFLGTYQVSGDVQNMINLDSYISTFLMLSFMMGLVFELPVFTWLFAKLGFISAPFLRRYRKHAIVLILIVAAIITPTSDVFTLLLVSLPIWLLYELSIFIIK